MDHSAFLCSSRVRIVHLEGQRWGAILPSDKGLISRPQYRRHAPVMTGRLAFIGPEATRKRSAGSQGRLDGKVVADNDIWARGNLPARTGGIGKDGISERHNAGPATSRMPLGHGWCGENVDEYQENRKPRHTAARVFLPVAKPLPFPSPSLL